MRKLTNLLFGLFFAVLLLSTTAEYVSAQGVKMGFVNDERIKTEYRAWQKAQEEWELEAKAWEEEATSKQDELQEMQDEYDKQKLILSEEKKKEREAAIKVKSDDLDAYTRRVFGPNGEAERKQAALLQPLLDNVNKAIEAVSVEEAFDVVFTLQSGLGYINPALDITDKVLKQLEENEG